MRTRLLFSLSLWSMAAAQSSPATPAPTVLTLTAPPGTSAQYRQTTRVSFEILDLHAEAQAGKPADPAALAARNSTLAAQLPQLRQALNQAGLSQAQVSRMTVRVLPPSQGNTVMLSTTSVELPGAQAGTKRSAEISTTLTYTPAGQIADVRITSSDPELQKVYQALDLNTLIQNAQTAGTTGLYGLPLTTGAHTSATSVPMQGLLTAMLSLVGADPQANTAQAEPLSLQVSTTYTGNDAQGIRRFVQQYTARPWKADLKLGDTALAMSVPNLLGQGRQSFRPDGLAQASTIHQEMTMQLRVGYEAEPSVVLKARYTTDLDIQLESSSAP